MVDIDTHVSGTPVWVDAMVPSIEKVAAMKTFLSGVFDWAWEQGGADTGHFSIATHRGRAVLGLGQMDATSGTLVTYFATHNVVASVVRDAVGRRSDRRAHSESQTRSYGPADGPDRRRARAGRRDFTGFGALYEIGATG